LWLYKANEWAKANLLKEAQNRGIDQQRLVFTSGTFHAHADYLARLRLADLFLDTFNYNAGSTASCALWAGVPVLTKQGASYTARMASSLLEAIELPELITATEESYENLALELATNPKKLQSIREKLTTKRDNAPLFDTESFTAHLEIAYQKVYGRYFSGAQP
jgi:predicted O-linked N-acetylglucosamine transferase (SPINDLY family)